MRSGYKVAVSGKGGVGKTTVCALLARQIARDGLDVLAIDADSDPNLAMALGIARDQRPEQLIKMKDLIEERTGAKPGSVGQYFKLNPKVSDLPEKFSTQIDGVKLLALGTISGAGSGCACPEGSFLKALLAHVILQRQEVVLIDLPAGLEFMGRACVQGVDGLIVVVEPGARSIETATNIANMAKQMGIEHVGAFANKANSEQLESIKTALKGIPLLGSFRYDPSLQTVDLEGRSVVDSNQDLTAELRNTKKRMLDLFFSEKV